MKKDFARVILVLILCLLKLILACQSFIWIQITCSQYDPDSEGLEGTYILEGSHHLWRGKLTKVPCSCICWARVEAWRGGWQIRGWRDWEEDNPDTSFVYVCVMCVVCLGIVPVTNTIANFGRPLSRDYLLKQGWNHWKCPQCNIA